MIDFDLTLIDFGFGPIAFDFTLIDLDFVLGKSTDGVFYFKETSEIYEAAITLCTATKVQMEQCFPRPINPRGYKKRTQQMKKFLSDLRAAQEAAAQEDANSPDDTEGAN